MSYIARVYFDGMIYERRFWSCARAERFALYEVLRLEGQFFTITNQGAGIGEKVSFRAKGK